MSLYNPFIVKTITSSLVSLPSLVFQRDNPNMLQHCSAVGLLLCILSQVSVLDSSRQCIYSVRCPCISCLFFQCSSTPRESAHHHSSNSERFVDVSSQQEVNSRKGMTIRGTWSTTLTCPQEFRISTMLLGALKTSPVFIQKSSTVPSSMVSEAS